MAWAVVTWRCAPGVRVSRRGYQCGRGVGVSSTICLGVGAPSRVSRSRCDLVGSVRRRKVPAKVPMWRRSSSRRMAGQVVPVRVSAMRTSSNASQHKMTWARMCFESVVDRLQIEDGFHVAPASFHFQELETDRDVLARQLRIRRSQ